MGFFSRAFSVFLMKESEKRRRKQPGKLMAKSLFTPGQFARCPALMDPLQRLNSHIPLSCIRCGIINYSLRDFYFAPIILMDINREV